MIFLYFAYRKNKGKSLIFSIGKFQIDRSRSSEGVIELPWAFWKALNLYFTRAKFCGEQIMDKKTAGENL